MLTVLIVDDNVSFRSQAARLCEKEGFTPVTAGNVSELSQVLATTSPDLVLIDIELPQIPGHRLGALIRARRHVPIVLVSALSEDRVRRLFEASDADGWICKPLTRDKLIAAVTRFTSSASAPSVAPPTPAASPSDQPAPSQHRVLVVEDEPIISDRIASVLAGSCAVTTVAEGDAAIERLTHGTWDCVLLDLMLPRLSGFDVLRHLMIRKPELLKKTVIMTAAADESLQFIDPSAVGGVLRKPFAVAALADIVASIAKG